MTILPDYLPLLAEFFAMIALAALLVAVVERKWPLAKPPAAEFSIDVKLSCLAVILNWLLSPLTGACAAMIVSLAGGGWIELRADGWWFPVSLVTIILTLDFVSYWVHRAQHAVPALWAMHSLHHSAEALTIVTGARHYWLEAAIQAALLPVLAVLFKIPTVFFMILPLFYFLPDACAHLNVRLSLGRFALWFNNPQYHRIHHSALPEHRDKNFCKMLPLFDLMFGTVWRPGPNEFPATGLVPSEKPRGLWDGFIWPLRGWVPVRSVGTAGVSAVRPISQPVHARGTQDAARAQRIAAEGGR